MSSKPADSEPVIQEYLGEKFFLYAFLAAVLLHLTGIYIWHLMPKTPVMEIPVRTLNIKLGDDDTAQDDTTAQPAVTNNNDVENTISNLIDNPAVTHSMDKAMEKPVAAD